MVEAFVVPALKFNFYLKKKKRSVGRFRGKGKGGKGGTPGQKR